MALYDPEEEQKLIFSKAYTCPVCSNKFHAMTVRSGKTRPAGTDRDLRRIFKGIDVNKYDTLLCNHCGYAVLTRYYEPLAKPFRDMLVQNVASRFKPIDEKEGVISYEEALKRYKLVQFNAMSRQAKNSEKAYICLKTAWVIRGMCEELEAEGEDSKEKIEALKEKELKYLESAMIGFIDARQSEMPPIAGMDDTTYDYLLAVLCFECGKYEDALHMAQSVILSSSAGNQQKDKARDLVAEIKATMDNLD